MRASAGVIGLSCAVQLQEAGTAVTIVAKDFPGPAETVDPVSQINYTSPWGGAHNRWVLPAPGDEGQRREHRMATVTYGRMQELAESHPEAGITFMKGIEYLERPSAVYESLTEEAARELGIEGFRRLAEGDLPAGVTWGCEYRTWCVNPMVYCSFLLRRFVHRGGRILKRELRGPLEAYQMPELGEVNCVVNASGIGFGDEKVFITRGQTCLVSNDCDATVTRQNADGSWTFCVPRRFDGGTIIGGTKEPNNWDPAPSLAVRKKLLANFATTYPPILSGTSSDGFCVIRDIVGRRPTRRGGIRLDIEQYPDSKSVVHAYGLGGRGYELSWGVANEASNLAQRVCKGHI